MIFLLPSTVPGNASYEAPLSCSEPDHPQWCSHCLSSALTMPSKPAGLWAQNLLWRQGCCDRRSGDRPEAGSLCCSAPTLVPSASWRLSLSAGRLSSEPAVWRKREPVGRILVTWLLKTFKNIYIFYNHIEWILHLLPCLSFWIQWMLTWTNIFLA